MPRDTTYERQAKYRKNMKDAGFIDKRTWVHESDMPKYIKFVNSLKKKRD